MTARLWTSKAPRALALGLLTAMLACDSPTTPTTPRSAMGTAQFHIGGAGIQTMIIEVDAPQVAAGQPVLVTAQLFVIGQGKDYTHPVGGQRLTLTIDGGAPYTEGTVRLGHAYFTLPPLDAGTYMITVEYDGDNHYGPAYKTVSLTVTP